MAEEQRDVAQGTATPAVELTTPAQPPVVEKANATPTEPSPTVSLADFKAVQDQLARLEAQTRKAQSERDRIAAGLRKSRKEELGAVDKIAPRMQWDEAEVQKQKSAIHDDYARRLVQADLDTEDEPEPVVNAQAAIPNLAPTAEAAKQGMLKKLERMGLSEKDMDLTPFLKQVSDPSEIATLDELWDKSIAQALTGQKTQAAKTAEEQRQEAKAHSLLTDLEMYGSVGGMNEPGTPYPAAPENPRTLDVDMEAILAKRYGKLQAPP